MIVLDFYLIGQELLYIFWRKPIFLRFWLMISGPFQLVHNEVHAFYNLKKYELNFTGQVHDIEHVLNDEFDNVNRQIFISDGINISEVYLFNTVENNEETYLYNVSEVSADTYLFSDSEDAALPDFIVNVPATIVFSPIAMRKRIEKYKCSGFTYDIETF